VYVGSCATCAVSWSPLSRAYRSFIGLNFDARSGSI
jgi:hypothetical protein